MPVKTPYSQVIQPNQFVQPIDLNLYARGIEHQEAIAKQNLQDVSQLYNNVFNIPTFGADKEKLIEKENELKNALSQINLSNLNTMESASQLKGLINKYANDADVQGIAQRYYSYQNELKRKQEAEEKGKQYVSPIVDEAEEYFNSGNYIQNKRFNRQGWLSPDITKAMQDAVKMATRDKYDVKTGFHTKEAKPEEISKAFYEIMKNNPAYQKDLQYSFEKETRNTNWQDEGQKFIQEKLQKLNSQFTEAVRLGDRETAQMVQNEYNRLQNLSDPTLIGDNLKQQYFQNYIQTQLDKVGYANDVSDFVKIERDPIQLKLMDFANQRQNKLYDLQLKTGLTRNKGESEAAFISRLAKEAQSKDLQIAQAKQDIKTEAAKTIDDYRTANKIEILNTKGEKIAIKDDGAKQFNLNGKVVDKKMLIENVARGDKKIIEQVINSNPEQFGNSSGVDPEGFFGLEGGIWITEDKDGIKYANYEADALVGGTKYRIPLTEIQKYIANPNHIVTVFSEDDGYKAPLKGSSLDSIDKSNIDEEVYVDADGNIVKGFTELSPEDQQLLLNNGVKKR